MFGQIPRFLAELAEEIGAMLVQWKLVEGEDGRENGQDPREGL